MGMLWVYVCVCWWCRLENACSGERHKTFFYGLCLLISCFLTVTVVSREGRQQVTWRMLRAILCAACHVAGIVYSNSCSFVYSFALCCEMEMAPWRSFIYLQDALDALVTLVGVNEQWSQDVWLKQTFFNMVASSQCVHQFRSLTMVSQKYCVSIASITGSSIFSTSLSSPSCPIQM